MAGTIAEGARIDVKQQWEVAWWCKELGVTESQLRRAIHISGPHAIHVKAHFDRKSCGAVYSREGNTSAAMTFQ